MEQRGERFLCIASYEKGHDFLRQCAELGVKVTLLTVEKLRDAEWPKEAIDEITAMPEGLTLEQIINTVSYLARTKRFDRVIALDEFDQESGAALREHMRLPGLDISTATRYRDKLAMRFSARDMGFRVPDFCRVLNYDEVREFLDRVPGPWLLKPRAEASALGIRRIEQPDQLWPQLDELGDRQSRFLLEKFVPGDIFHVDSIIHLGRVVFSVVHQYGRPPMEVMHEGGVFTTRTVDRASRDWLELSAINASLAPGLGMKSGVTHAEFIRSHENGEYYFLEIAARVGGAFIADLVEAAAAVNLWREWAKLEVADLFGELYQEPKYRELYAGSVLCLANTEEPDTSSFDAPEVIKHVKKSHHAGLIVRSAMHLRVKSLLDQYSAEFAGRFLAIMPPREKPTA